MLQNSFTKPKSLVDQIKRELSMAIAKGKLLPGQQLKETELQEWFGVSRAPIREALRLLQGDGLIVVDNYKKRYVRRITKKDLKEILPVMACLEGLAAKIAALTITNEEIKELKKINVKLQTACKQKNYKLCAELNYQFHTILIKAVNNEALNRTIRCLSKGSIWFWITNIYYNTDELISLSIAEHKTIIDAFIKRDAETAEKEVREHITKVFKRAIKLSDFNSDGNLQLTIPAKEKNNIFM